MGLKWLGVEDLRLIVLINENSGPAMSIVVYNTFQELPSQHAHPRVPRPGTGTFAGPSRSSRLRRKHG